jgi:hypothetical protein
VIATVEPSPCNVVAQIVNSVLLYWVVQSEDATLLKASALLLLLFDHLLNVGEAEELAIAQAVICGIYDVTT